MPELSLDTDRASALATDLARWALQADDAGRVVRDAVVLASLASTVPLRMDWIERNARAAGLAVDEAVAVALAFALPPIDGFGSTAQPSPIGDRSWDRVRQIADHNTYLYGTVRDRRDLHRHAHEFDLHVGEPTRLVSPAAAVPWAELGRIVVDAAKPDGELAGDWHVYHSSLDPHSSYESLGSALDDLVDDSSTVPVTVFLDLKDALGDSHGPAVLDDLLRTKLGDRLWTPQDLLARAPAEATLVQAIAEAGWPTVDSLSGRVMVVLTGDVVAYHDSVGVDEAAAFVAARPGRLTLADPNVVVYNEHQSRIDAADITAIRAQHALLRVWGAASPDQNDATRNANWVAID